MKIVKKYFLSLVFLWTLVGALAQNENSIPLPTKAINGIKAGNADELKPYLNNKIEIVIPQKSGVFSKEQAHFILKDFFEKHKVTSFTVLHHGTRQNATFAIAEYKCPKEKYRMYFLIKETNNQSLIHQIRIETQDE